MSRVAAAVKKSRGTAITGTSRQDEQAERVRQAKPWTTSESPWDFNAPVQLRREQPGVARRPEITAVRRRSLPDPGAVSPDELTRLVQRIFQPGVAEPRIRSVLFSAFGPAGASAKLCAAVADTLASQTSRSVCLVDANLRAPSLHASFGVDSSPGLSDLLLDGHDLRGCLKALAHSLWLLPGGSCSADTLAQLTADRVRPCVLELLASFDYVLMDTSSASMHGEATLLGPLLDGVLLVAEANATRREAAKRTTELLQATGATILGAVLTNRTFPIPERIYRML
jgi:succinoglycan biosynthesis transport protein ExoP